MEAPLGQLRSQRYSQAGMPKLGLYSASGEPRPEPAIAGPLEPGAEHVTDEPFPLGLFPSQVRTAIMNEFDGRCPSLQEVAEIPDARWLSTPAVGPVVLRKIRGLDRGDAPPSRPMTNTELLRRLTSFQEEFKLIQRTLRTTLPRRSRQGHPRHRGLPGSSGNRLPAGPPGSLP